MTGRGTSFPSDADSDATTERVSQSRSQQHTKTNMVLDSDLNRTDIFDQLQSRPIVN